MIEAIERTESAGETLLHRESDFAFTYFSPEQRPLQRLLVRGVERLTGARHFERLYREWSAAPPPDETIFAAGLRLLDVETVVDGASWDSLPRTGPLLIVANHPYGVIDGLALSHLATKLRSDAKIMTHSLLCQPKEARDYLLPVDFATTPTARARTLSTCRRALSWLSDGHALAMFPGGGVSTSQSPWRGKAIDPAWYPFLGKLAEQPGLTILPVFIHGQNSRLFQMASHTNYALRIALLFRESARMEGAGIRLTLGAPIKPGHLSALGSRVEVMQEIRRRCYALAGANGPDPEQEFQWPKHIRWD